MNNHRLLTGLLCATLSGAGTCAYGQPRVVSIEELFETAESRSIQMRPALSAEEEAARDISVAKSGRLPDINTTLSLSYIGDGFTTKRNFSDRQKAPIPHFGNGFGINISQPIYTGGTIRNNIKLAELRSTASRFETELQRDNIRFRLTGFYLDIFKYRNLKKVVENNKIQAEKVLVEMQARYEQGTALKNDITRYELLVSNLELQLIKINNILDILNRNLVVTAGLPETTVIVPDSTILSRSLPSATEEWWQKEAVTNSPSVRLADTGVEMGKKAEALAKSDLCPKIGLQAGWTIDGPILVEVPPINRNLSYWYVGVGVNYSLSSLYKSNKSISKSKAATRTAIDRLEATKENIRLGIREDYIRYLEAYEEVRTQEKSVELAERNYHTTYTRYSADMALITDMLDAANSRLDAEQTLVNARINIIYYYYKLLFTSGKI